MMLSNLILSVLLLHCRVLLATSSRCPCQNADLCGPVTTIPKKHVFAFATNPVDNFSAYDWTRLTTLCVFNPPVPPELMCLAHAHHVRVVVKTDFPASQLGNTTAVRAWANALLQQAKDHHLDGVNIDFEQPIQVGSRARQLLVDAVRLVADLFHRELPHTQVSFDAAWSPRAIDDRAYDLQAIASIVDIVFVMAYDTRSQVYDQPCTAGPNSPISAVRAGLLQYIDQLQVPPSKLVLGVPWYGYNYPCIAESPSHRPVATSWAKSVPGCRIKQIPFHGAPCSDAAGTQLDFRVIQGLLRDEQDARRGWDEQSQTPFVTVNLHGARHQIWYDDPQSLSIKYSLARELKMAGVGMWGIDFLDYDNATQVASMFSAMDVFLLG